MEWLLLYPAIGLFWFPWFYRNEKRYHKREDRFNGIQTLLTLIILWPAAIWMSPPDWKRAKEEAALQRERDFQVLEERVRREARARTRREFAEFDKELGIEPEWKKAHPVAAKEYDKLMFSAGGYIRHQRSLTRPLKETKL